MDNEGASDRALATIREISHILPIEGADKIELAKIDGWSVVVQKSEGYVSGSHVVFCEIDSVLPERPEFEFLASKKYRIKSIRLRGQLSQGIAFPLSILPENTEVSLGDNVTELLGIKKYEPPINPALAGISRGNFPSFIPKTDESRVQNLQGLLTKYKHTPVYVTEKLDGSSMTVYLKDGEFHVCSRNMDLVETEGNAFWIMARALDLEGKLREHFGDNVALQGELIGGRIQGNPLKRPSMEFYVFNMLDLETGDFWNYDAFRHTIEYLGLNTVPILDDEYILHDNIDEWLNLAEGYSAINPQVLREGLVIRPKVETRDERHGRVSFKAISNLYLLKTGG